MAWLIIVTFPLWDAGVTEVSFLQKIVLRKQFIVRFAVFTHFVMLPSKEVITRDFLARDTRLISSHVCTLGVTMRKIALLPGVGDGVNPLPQ